MEIKTNHHAPVNIFMCSGLFAEFMTFYIQSAGSTTVDTISDRLKIFGGKIASVLNTDRHFSSSSLTSLILQLFTQHLNCTVSYASSRDDLKHT